MEKLLRRVWAEIDLDALENNISLIKGAAGGKPIMAVVKADAYGHCAEIVCSKLWECGVKSYAVSNILEALDVRRTLPEAQIVIFGYCDPEWQQEILENGLEQTAASLDAAAAISEFGVKHNTKMKVHIKVNTGMNRVGIDTGEELIRIMNMRGLDICGVYTHFSCADSLDPQDAQFTRDQQRKLMEIAAPAAARGIPIYSQNSAGMLYHGEFSGDMIRSGIITYGCKPNTAVGVPLAIKPIMRLRARVCQVKTVPEGQPISYSRTYVTKKRSVIAVIPAGYADGYSRALSNNGVVYINGQRAPIVGRVCMDQMMADVTGLDVKPGDIAELYSDTIEEISVDSIADRLGTIGYELLCLVSKRVPRAAVRNGKITEVRSYI